MILLHLTSMAVAVSAGTMPPSAIPSVWPARADSVTETLLTDDEMKHYIAIRKDLEEYWKVPAHEELHKTAQSKAHPQTVMIGQISLQIEILDYPELMKQDAGIAAIFKKNQFTPERYGTDGFNVAKALATLSLAEQKVDSLPDSASVTGKNIAVVKAHQDELKAVGAVLQQNGGGGGGAGGAGEDLDP